MSSNTPFEAVDVIRARKPGFTPRIAMILGSGLGVLAEQMLDAVTISYAKPLNAKEGDRLERFQFQMGTGF